MSILRVLPLSNHRKSKGSVKVECAPHHISAEVNVSVTVPGSHLKVSSDSTEWILHKQGSPDPIFNIKPDRTTHHRSGSYREIYIMSSQEISNINENENVPESGRRFIRSRQDYKRYSDCFLYELLEGGSVHVIIFQRHRTEDTVFDYTVPVPGPKESRGFNYLYCKYDHRNAIYRSISKSETEEILEGFLHGAIHLPFGCTDGSTPLGKYWMYREEALVTDSIPPLEDRIGVRDWTIFTNIDREQHLRGTLGEIVPMVLELEAIDSIYMIDRCLGTPSDGEESNNINGSREPVYFIADDMPDIRWTTDHYTLTADIKGQGNFRIMTSSIDHFHQRTEGDP